MNVSVIIPVYNAAKYVEEAVCSILGQRFVEKVILVEDGSKDESLAVCRRLAYSEARILLVQHSGGENRGPGASRNVGAELCESDLVAFLDADDIGLPNKFHVPVNMLAENPSIDGVYEAVGAMCENAGAQERWDAFGGDELTTISKMLHPRELFYHLVMGKAGHFHLDGFVIRKKLFVEVGGFNELLRLHQDSDFCMKAAALGKLVSGRLNQPVALRRVHEGNRFVKVRDDAVESRLMQWRELYKWANDTKQGNWKKLIICYRLMNYLKAHYRRTGNLPAAVSCLVMGRLMRFVISARRGLLGASSF
jgi:glycosyltransferase involved in cell wall biosynthesis